MAGLAWRPPANRDAFKSLPPRDRGQVGQRIKDLCGEREETLRHGVQGSVRFSYLDLEEGGIGIYYNRQPETLTVLVLERQSSSAPEAAAYELATRRWRSPAG